MKLFEIISNTKTRGKDIAVVSACDIAQAVDTLVHYGELNYDPEEYDDRTIRVLSPYSIFEVPKVISEEYTGANPVLPGDIPVKLDDLEDVDVERACDGDILIRRADKWISTPLQDVKGIDDKNFVYLQSRPAKDWFIRHCLGKMPSVSIVNSSDQVIYGDIEYDSTDPGNKLTIHFTVEVSGKATLN